MNYIEGFKRKLELDNKDHKTIKVYCEDILQFEKHISRKKNIKDIDYKKVTLEDIEDYLYDVKQVGGRNGSGASINTLNRKIASLKRFYKFLRNRDYVEKNIMESVEKINDRNKKKIETLTLAEIKALKQAPYKAGVYFKEIEFQKTRDNLMLYLFLNTGLRDMELRNLEVKDIDLEKRILSVNKAKMHQTRKFFIDDEGIKLFKEYLYEHSIKKNLKDHNILMVSIAGRRMNYGSSTRDILKRLLSESGIDSFRIDSISQHILRHTFATMSLRYGNNMSDISQQLGHRSEATTRNFYIHEGDRDIENRRITVGY